MIGLLAKLFIKSPPDPENEDIRRGYGVLCGSVGIGFNIILCALKLAAGIVSGSLAITADALNNLSDAGSSIITIIGFRLAASKPDLDHPFGHGRMEYLSGLAVSAAIVIVGFELGKSSVEKILNPTPLEFSWLLVGILAVSIAVKLYMAFYNRSYAKKVNSPALKATAADSLGDCITTSAVLLSLLVFKAFGVDIDAYCGLAVSLFILYSGIQSAKDTIGPLLGAPADKDFCRHVEEIVMSHEKIVGVHDLIVHDYGPGRRMITLHAEVPATGDFCELHDLVDNIEHDLRDELHCIAVIHMDPIETDNEVLSQARNAIAQAVKQIDPGCTVHDVRLVSGPTHTNVIFDLLVPFSLKLPDDEIKRKVVEIVNNIDETYTAVVTVDRSFTE